MLGGREKEENRGPQNTQSTARPPLPFNLRDKNHNHHLPTCPHQQQTNITFQRVHISSRPPPPPNSNVPTSAAEVCWVLQADTLGTCRVAATFAANTPGSQACRSMQRKYADPFWEITMTQTPSGKSELRGSLWEIGTTRFLWGGKSELRCSVWEIGTTRLPLRNRNYEDPSTQSELRGSLQAISCVVPSRQSKFCGSLRTNYAVPSGQSKFCGSLGTIKILWFPPGNRNYVVPSGQPKLCGSLRTIKIKSSLQAIKIMFWRQIRHAMSGWLHQLGCVAKDTTPLRRALPLTDYIRTGNPRNAVPSRRPAYSSPHVRCRHLKRLSSKVGSLQHNTTSPSSHQ